MNWNLEQTGQKDKHGELVGQILLEENHVSAITRNCLSTLTNQFSSSFNERLQQCRISLIYQSLHRRSLDNLVVHWERVGRRISHISRGGVEEPYPRVGRQ